MISIDNSKTMIYETVVSTANSKGETHLAPMGVRKVDGLYLIAPFSPSTTLNNLIASGEAIINLTDDVRVIAGCLSGRRDWPLTASSKLGVKRLADCLSHVEIEVTKQAGDEQRPEFYCRKVHSENHAEFLGFNRAQAAVLEAAILASRLDMLPREKIVDEIRYLQIAIDKTAGIKENQAWGWLMEKIDNHFEKNAAGGKA